MIRFIGEGGEIAGEGGFEFRKIIGECGSGFREIAGEGRKLLTDVSLIQRPFKTIAIISDDVYIPRGVYA
ncbi:hypothetical protein Tco_0303415 [Tanacetum coccineum]